MANDVPFIIKKIKKGGHAHHGGAWKIAYADFVTAMMAFFLLLWLISMTTPEQKKGLADYFAPPNVSETTNGAGGVLAGTAFDDSAAKMSGSNSEAKSFTAPQNPDGGPMISVKGAQEVAKGSTSDAVKASSVNMQSTFNQEFHSAAASIRQAWEADPDITNISSSLVVEETPDGLNIKILDQEGRPMFPEGSKYPYEATRKAIAAIAPILQKLSNLITITGHTAAGSTYSDPRYGAWELSMDRANTVRSILGEFGLTDDHIGSVVGRAAADPLFPNDPYLAGNGRIEITVSHKPPPVPAGLSP